jgi:hypothetical protein
VYVHVGVKRWALQTRPNTRERGKVYDRVESMVPEHLLHGLAVPNIAAHELKARTLHRTEEIAALLFRGIEGVEGIEAHHLATLREQPVDQC